ncbi:hypothetical protein Stsp02_11320 [Streptomyces sp. NBRC 14336]|nr:hypothetical protein Stsp02_11320 [Streptomyces sp. NBRC 14336]
MRPVTPFMAIRTVLRVTSVPSQKSYAVVRAAYAPMDRRDSKRFLSSKKLASEQGLGQDRDEDELFEGANNRGAWP